MPSVYKPIMKFCSSRSQQVVVYNNQKILVPLQEIDNIKEYCVVTADVYKAFKYLNLLKMTPKHSIFWCKLLGHHTSDYSSERVLVVRVKDLCELVLNNKYEDNPKIESLKQWIVTKLIPCIKEICNDGNIECLNKYTDYPINPNTTKAVEYVRERHFYYKQLCLNVVIIKSNKIRVCMPNLLKILEVECGYRYNTMLPKMRNYVENEEKSNTRYYFFRSVQKEKTITELGLYTILKDVERYILSRDFLYDKRTALDSLDQFKCWWSTLVIAELRKLGGVDIVDNLPKTCVPPIVTQITESVYG